MAQPESHHPDSEEFHSSELKDESASNESSGSDEGESFVKDVEDMLDSIDTSLEDSEGTGGLEKSEVEGLGIEAEKDEPSDTASDALLMQAGSILNGGDTELPDFEPEELPEVASEDELLTMADPQSLAEAQRDDEANIEERAAEVDENELVTKPDPQSLMGETDVEEGADDSLNTSDAEGEAGDLPPPPAPVALEEDEIKQDLSVPVNDDSGETQTETEGESPEAEKPVAKAEPPQNETPDAESEKGETEPPATNAEPKAVESETADSDGGDSEDDSDDFELEDGDSFLSDDDDDEEDLLASFQSNKDVTSAEETDASAQPADLESSSSSHAQATVSDKPAKRLWGKALRSLPLAAALALVGIGLIVSSFKSEIFELVGHGNVQGSLLSQRIALLTKEVFDEISPEMPYEMAWLESGIKRVSESELIIEAQIGAKLKADLYEQVDDSFVFSKLPFDSDELSAAATMLESIEQGDGIGLPEKGWKRLYKHSASMGEVFPINVSYRLLKNSSDSKWELSNLRMKEGNQGVVWTRGRPKEFFGHHALDVKSNEFALAFRAFEKAGLSFLIKARAAERNYLAKLDEEAHMGKEEREKLLMSLSQGSYFKGMVIAGKEGADAREVSLIITETRNNGGLIKGVLKLEKSNAPAKHFTGFFDVVEGDQGVQGQLDLTTIAFSDQPAMGETPLFFNPGTVSKIKLQTDGYSMEGDAEEVSLRLIRTF